MSETEYIVTAQVGDNSDLFPNVCKLYIPEGSRVLDMTYGKGIWWNQMNESDYDLVRNDIDSDRGDVTYDFTKGFPYESQSFDAVLLDPPYLYTGGFKTLKHSYDGIYKNKERSLDQDIHGVDGVHQMYALGMIEAYRLLKKRETGEKIGGVLVVKCMDQVMSGKQEWQPDVLMRLGEYFGFRSEDKFVLVNPTQPVMRHKNQIHARRNHSYFLVFNRYH